MKLWGSLSWYHYITVYATAMLKKKTFTIEWGANAHIYKTFRKKMKMKKKPQKTPLL